MTKPVLQLWKPGTSSWVWAALPIDDYLSLSAKVEHLGFGELSFTLPADHDAVEELLTVEAMEGSRLITVDREVGRFGTFLADRFQLNQLDDGREQYSLAAAENALELLEWPNLWPNPALALDAQVDAADVYPGSNMDVPAEDVIRHFVATAMLNRWAAGSTVPPIVNASLGRGAAIRGRGRFQSLWQLVSNRAALGGLGVTVGLVDTTPSSAQLHVSCYLPTDRTDEAVFAADLGTLRTWQFAATPRTVGRAIVGDAGEGATRHFLSRTAGSPASWGGYRELFVPSDSFDPPENQQTGDAALAEGAGGVTFDMTTSDTEGMQFQVDYDLADTVTVDIGFLRRSAPVASVTLTVDDKGVQVKPVVGDPSGTDPLFSLGSIISAYSRRITPLEAK